MAVRSNFMEIIFGRIAVGKEGLQPCEFGHLNLRMKLR
jgi:hypothetical protein